MSTRSYACAIALTALSISSASCGSNDASGATPGDEPDSSVLSGPDGGNPAHTGDAGNALGNDAGTVVDGGGAADVSTGPLPASLVVATNRNDNLRSSANLQETILTPANVTTSTFGLLFSRAVDAQIYGQPLYLSALKLPDGTTRNVVFVTTANNSVYAFDADDKTASTPLWQKSLGAAGQTTAFGCTDMVGTVGITSTPVIDPQAGNLYIVSKAQNTGTWVQQVHVLDVTTGSERPGSPLTISATVPGTGAGSNGTTIDFNPKTELNRPGLLLQDGILYIAFSSHCDSGPYHGWVLGYHYDGKALTQTRVLNVSANGTAGGIWQAGVGLSSDGTSLFFAAGNGSTNPLATPPDLSESVVRLALSDFTAKDYWTPTNYSALDQGDADLSSGATLLPHDLLMTGSKDGRIYLLDRSNLGKLNTTADAILQTVTSPGKTAGHNGHVHGGPAYYQDPVGGDEWVLIWPESSPLMRYTLDPTARKLTNLVTSAIATPGHPGAFLALSANGKTKGSAILWAAMASGSDPDGAWHKTVPGTLYAIDPSTSPPAVLWNSDQNAARDAVGDFAKFNTPTVANGHVYLATFSSTLRVYGLLP